MARLQILELPEGADDSRPPFVLVVDESAPQRVILGMDGGRVGDYWQGVAVQIGARGVIVTAETVEIPSNEIAAEFREGVRESVAELYESASGSLASSIVPRIEDVEGRLSESETLGHKLLQRAENAEGRSQAMEVQRDRAEAERVAADNMLRAVCEVFGGPHQDPVVKARETLARAEAAEQKLNAYDEEGHRLDIQHMDAITDALGFDRLRNWGEIVDAIATDGGHRFNVPGYLDPQRCANCGLDRLSWASGRDRRTCAEKNTAEGF